jgi:hypothetical protein
MCEFRFGETVKLGILTQSNGHTGSYPAHEIGVLAHDRLGSLALARFEMDASQMWPPYFMVSGGLTNHITA